MNTSVCSVGLCIILLYLQRPHDDGKEYGESSSVLMNSVEVLVLRISTLYYSTLHLREKCFTFPQLTEVAGFVVY